MLLPDTAEMGGDSHTRFPIGISFPACSGLVAFAAATGSMSLDMPESILVRFKVRRFLCWESNELASPFRLRCAVYFLCKREQCNLA